MVYRGVTCGIGVLKKMQSETVVCPAIAACAA